MYSSHRIRAQERVIARKLVLSIVILVGGVFLAIFAGLPLLAKLAVGLSLLKGDEAKVTETAESPVFAPILEPLPQATNSSSILIRGYSDKDRQIIISVNGENAGSTETDSDGKFSFRNIRLNEGENKISVISKSKDNESEPADLTILFKKEPPVLEITEPSDGQTLRIEAKTLIKGYTDPDTNLSINDHRIIIDRDGNFSYPVTLSEGENIYQIKSEDTAGNQTVKELKINFAP